LAEFVGYVLERKGQRAKVRIDKSEALGSGIPKFLDCWNACEAKVGMEVEVGKHAMNSRTEKAILYGIPLLSAIAGGAFGNSLALFFQWPRLPVIIVGVFLWLAIGWSYIGAFRRDVAYRGEQWTIIGVYQGKPIDKKQEEK